MRPASLLILCASLISAACSDELLDRETAELAVDQASIAVQCQLITSSLADIASTTPGGATAEARAEALATGTSKLLDCGVVEAQGSAVRIAFSGLGCLVNNQRLWGEVLIDVAEMPHQAQLTLSEVTDSGLSITGQTILALSDGLRTVTDQATVTLNNADATSYVYLDHRTESVTASGITVDSGSRCSTLASSTAECTFSSSGTAVCAEPEGDCQTVTSQGAVLLRGWDVATDAAQSAPPHTVGLRMRTRAVELAYTLSSSAIEAMNGTPQSADDVDVTIDTTVREILKTPSDMVGTDSDLEPSYAYEIGDALTTFTFQVIFP
ncbi:MAG: hypothetical protein ACPGU1_05925 [Myxococcota bacterium]